MDVDNLLAQVVTPYSIQLANYYHPDDLLPPLLAILVKIG